MPNLTEPQRAKILGLNAARFFKLAVPERYPDRAGTRRRCGPAPVRGPA